jgi:hypothetical protein
MLNSAPITSGELLRLARAGLFLISPTQKLLAPTGDAARQPPLHGLVGFGWATAKKLAKPCSMPISSGCEFASYEH